MSGKVVPLSVAVTELVTDGGILGVGGWGTANVPMALAREIVRRGLKVGTVMGNSLAVDLLAAGRVGRRYLVGLQRVEPYGPFPALRALMDEESDAVEVVDGSYLGLAYMAAAMGMAYFMLPETLQASPVLTGARWLQWSEDGRLAVPAIVPDVALVHCQEADDLGNAIFRGATFCDLWLALAARHVIIQSESVVDRASLSKVQGGFRLSGFVVDMVVEAPMGCHPCASHRYYNHDHLHLQAYFRSASSPQGMAHYLETFVRGVADDAAYQDRAREPWAI